jgi:hypothetical protein
MNNDTDKLIAKTAASRGKLKRLLAQVEQQKLVVQKDEQALLKALSGKPQTEAVAAPAAAVQQ